VKIRLSIFAVGDRGELHRRDERRIQITTTYLSGLERLGDYADIVLGYDSTNDLCVGLDPRRLEFGGKKHNASSSVDPTALQRVPAHRISIRPHETRILGLEYQAIFKPERLAEYVFNVNSIHRNLYAGGGSFSSSRRPPGQPIDVLTVPSENASGEVLILATSMHPVTKHKFDQSKIAAFESGDSDALADLSPEMLEAIRRKCAENGDRGEYFAYKFERQRLRKAGKDILAEKVDWVSRRAVGKGYDIKSFENDGSPRFVEVKSTSGKGMTFLMSDGEWKAAAREKEAYYVYRIVHVDSAPKLGRVVQDPVAAEQRLALEKVTTGWRIKLR
jgi:hypothetical protein